MPLRGLFLLFLPLLLAACARRPAVPRDARFDVPSWDGTWIMSSYAPNFYWLHNNDSTASPATPVGLTAADLRRRGLRRIRFGGYVARSPVPTHAHEAEQDGGVHELLEVRELPAYDTVLVREAAERFDLQFDRRGYLTEGRAMRYDVTPTDSFELTRWHLRRTYDNAGRLTRSEVEQHSTDANQVPGGYVHTELCYLITVRYDAAGRRSQWRAQHRWQGQHPAGWGSPTMDSTAMDVLISYKYHRNGRLQTVTQTQTDARSADQWIPQTMRTVTRYDERGRRLLSLQEQAEQRAARLLPKPKNAARETYQAGPHRQAEATWWHVDDLYQYDCRTLWLRRRYQPQRQLRVNQSTSYAARNHALTNIQTRWQQPADTASRLDRLLWRQRLSVTVQQFTYDAAGLPARVESRTCHDRGCLQPQGQTRVKKGLARRLLRPQPLCRPCQTAQRYVRGWPLRASEQQIYTDFRYDYFR